MMLEHEQMGVIAIRT